MDGAAYSKLSFQNSRPTHHDDVTDVDAPPFKTSSGGGGSDGSVGEDMGRRDNQRETMPDDTAQPQHALPVRVHDLPTDGEKDKETADHLTRDSDPADFAVYREAVAGENSVHSTTPPDCAR